MKTQEMKNDFVFETSWFSKFIFCLMALTVALIPVTFYFDSGGILIRLLVGEIFFFPMGLFFLWFAFQKYSCTSKSFREDTLYSHKEIFWSEIKEAKAEPGLRGGPSIYVSSDKKKINFPIGTFQKKDVLKFVELLKQKAINASIEIDENLIEEAFLKIS